MAYYSSDPQPRDVVHGPSKPRQPRRLVNQDEFDGPSKFLPTPSREQELARSQSLPNLPTNLSIWEQEQIMESVSGILCQCAFHFVAEYQFPIPIERGKPDICKPADRHWTEWAYLLKRLATKRRIPKRVVRNGEIKQLVPVLENSTVSRTFAQDSNGTQEDDRYMLQQISAGTQVAKVLIDSDAMTQLDILYRHIESVIWQRRRGLACSLLLPTQP